MQSAEGLGGQEPTAQAGIPYSLEQEKAQLEAMNRELTQLINKMSTLSCKLVIVSNNIAKELEWQA